MQLGLVPPYWQFRASWDITSVNYIQNEWPTFSEDIIAAYPLKRRPGESRSSLEVNSRSRLLGVINDHSVRTYIRHWVSLTVSCLLEVKPLIACEQANLHLTIGHVDLSITSFQSWYRVQQGLIVQLNRATLSKLHNTFMSVAGRQFYAARAMPQNSLSELGSPSVTDAHAEYWMADPRCPKISACRVIVTPCFPNDHRFYTAFWPRCRNGRLESVKAAEPGLLKRSRSYSPIASR